MLMFSIPVVCVCTYGCGIVSSIYCVGEIVLLFLSTITYVIMSRNYCGCNKEQKLKNNSKYLALRGPIPSSDGSIFLRKGVKKLFTFSDRCYTMKL